MKSPNPANVCEETGKGKSERNLSVITLPKECRIGNQTFLEIAKSYYIAQRAAAQVDRSGNSSPLALQSLAYEKQVAQSVLRIVAEIGESVLAEEGQA